MSLKVKIREHEFSEYNRKPTSKYSFLETSVIQDPRLSFEGKGAYVMLEAHQINLSDLSQNIINELIEVGYLEEVKE